MVRGCSEENQYDTEAAAEIIGDTMAKINVISSNHNKFVVNIHYVDADDGEVHSADLLPGNGQIVNLKNSALLWIKSNGAEERVVICAA